MRVFLLVGVFCLLAGCSYVQNSPQEPLEPVQIEAEGSESLRSKPQPFPMTEYLDASVVASISR